MLEINCALERGSFQLDVAFEAPGAAVTALFGRSGSGKTTLMSVLSGLLSPERGRIALDGETLLDTARGINLPAERRALGYVFQDGRLFPHLSVRGNLNYGLRRAQQRPAQIGLSGVVELLGLGGLLERRVAGLSGGERQRVALARALLMQPRALLLDEPLASLDAARKDEVLPYFERLRDEHRLPIIYVSHSFDEVLRL